MADSSSRDIRTKGNQIQNRDQQYGHRFQINSKYCSEGFTRDARSCLGGNHPNSLPFPHFSLSNFITDAAARWHRKSNDLYALNQTADLQGFDSTKFPALYAFRKFWWKEFGIGYKRLVRYDQTDILLPHDDRLEKRAFAFVFYLSPDWLEEYGGNLLLYDTDVTQNRPAIIAKSIRQLKTHFFCSGSSKIPGIQWLNGAVGRTYSRVFFAKLRPSLDISLAEVEAWLNPEFVRPTEHKKIKRIFALKSELSLENFLNAEKYKQALQELESSTFDTVGPPDKRKVRRLDESKIGKQSAVGTLLRLFRSKAMTLLLTQWTGLRAVRSVNDSMGDCQLQPAAKKMRCGVSELPADSLPSTSQQDSAAKSGDDITSDVQIVSCMNRYEHGCYSMADDQLAADAKATDFAWIYFALDDTEEILRVPPSMNTAAIVFREPEVLNFTKYVNCLAGDKHFYVLNCSFFGVSNEDSESEDSLESDDEGALPVDLAIEDAELDEDEESPPEDAHAEIADANKLQNSSCPPGWIPFTENKCVKLSSEGSSHNKFSLMNYEQANEYCKSLSGESRLISLSNNEVSVLLEALSSILWKLIKADYNPHTSLFLTSGLREGSQWMWTEDRVALEVEPAGRGEGRCVALTFADASSSQNQTNSPTRDGQYEGNITTSSSASQNRNSRPWCMVSPLLFKSVTYPFARLLPNQLLVTKLLRNHAPKKS
uniref:Kringle domain-containing protein n=1 Tax=Ditylenchus dipsaci TaxID=166011 RepID=A0A915CYV4_9BILA